MKSNPTYLGIDVSKNYLDLASSPAQESMRYQNTAAGITDLVEYARNTSPALVVMEAGIALLAYYLLSP